MRNIMIKIIAAILAVGLLLPEHALAVDIAHGVSHLLPQLRTAQPADTKDKEAMIEWTRVGTAVRAAQALKLQLSRHTLKDLLDMDEAARGDAARFAGAREEIQEIRPITGETSGAITAFVIVKKGPDGVLRTTTYSLNRQSERAQLLKLLDGTKVYVQSGEEERNREPGPGQRSESREEMVSGAQQKTVRPETREQSRSYVVRPLTKELAEQHKSKLARLHNKIIHTRWTEEEFMADLWPKGQWGRTEDRVFVGKWEHSFVALNKEGTPVGYLLAYERKGGEIAGVPETTLYIHGISVDPGWKRRGIGGRLLYEAARNLKEHGSLGLRAYSGPRHMTLQVNIESLDAIKLYERAGFNRIGEKELREGVKDLIYRAAADDVIKSISASLRGEERTGKADNADSGKDISGRQEPLNSPGKSGGQIEQPQRETGNLLVSVYRSIQKRYPGVVELAKFCIVGFSGVFVDMAMVVALRELAEIDIRPAAVGGFLAAVSTNYLLNRFWTFDGASKTPFLKGYASFVATCCGGLVARLLMMHALISMFAGLSYGRWYIVTNFIGIAAGTIVNFIGSKFLVFGKKDKNLSRGEAGKNHISPLAEEITTGKRENTEEKTSVPAKKEHAGDLHNGMQSTIRFPAGMDDIRSRNAKALFMAKCRKDKVFQRLSGINEWFEGIMNEAAKNSYDSVVDRAGAPGNELLGFFGKISFEAGYAGKYLVIKITDNGLPAELGGKGIPVRRRRDPISHMGGARQGIKEIKRALKMVNGDIRWQPTEEGTLTTIRIPRKNIERPLSGDPGAGAERGTVQDGKKEETTRERSEALTGEKLVTAVNAKKYQKHAAALLNRLELPGSGLMREWHSAEVELVSALLAYLGDARGQEEGLAARLKAAGFKRIMEVGGDMALHAIIASGDAAGLELHSAGTESIADKLEGVTYHDAADIRKFKSEEKFDLIINKGVISAGTGGGGYLWAPAEDIKSWQDVERYYTGLLASMLSLLSDDPRAAVFSFHKSEEEAVLVRKEKLPEIGGSVIAWRPYPFDGEWRTEGYAQWSVTGRDKKTAEEKAHNKEGKIDPREELIRAVKFIERIKLIQAKQEKQVKFIALDTSWINGYENRGVQNQFEALNPLISQIRRYCGRNNIEFIGADQKTVLEYVGKKSSDPTARGIVLGAAETIDLLGLDNNENILLAAVDGRGLTELSYIPIMEMLTLSMDVFMSESVSATYIQNSHPLLGFRRQQGIKNRITFVPKAQKADTAGELRNIYRVQISA